ncbi:MAG: hypothetical protein ACRDT6_19700, partial [Micromonosporaceae bacterium]
VNLRLAGSPPGLRLARPEVSRQPLIRGLYAVPLAVLLAVAGCGTTPENSADGPSKASQVGPSAAAPQPRDTRVPLAKLGAPCALLSYQQVDKALGVEFDIADAGKDGTSCALQVNGHVYPDLTLTSVATKADAKGFAEQHTPDGADTVKGLGQAGYRITRSPDKGSGPRAEVGWLAKGKIYVLRYTFEKGTSDSQAATMTTKLVALAKQLKTG